jgi:hypothetical protein
MQEQIANYITTKIQEEGLAEIEVISSKSNKDFIEIF